MIDLVLAAAAVISPVEAERQFAADAQTLGQWTAFRKWATGDAVMFVPRPANAQAWLKDRKDPPVAVFWWPGRSYVSCDGKTAVNTGPWVREWGKSVGYFTTVWRREGDSWRWTYDAGDSLAVPRSEGGDIKPVVASCKGRPSVPPGLEHDPQFTKGGGQSADGTLRWLWTVRRDGARRFLLRFWTGAEYATVIDDQVAPER